MSWVQTWSGRAIDLVNPDPALIYLEDVARHLSKACRFAGACAFPYSVAQHSVYVSEIVPTEDAMQALMHDAEEYVLGDWTAPLKAVLRARFGPEVTELFAVHRRAVCDRFGLAHELPASVLHADLVMLATEKRDLMAAPPRPWVDLPEPRPAPFRIEQITHEEACDRFMARYVEILDWRDEPKVVFPPKRKSR